MEKNSQTISENEIIELVKSFKKKDELKMK